jgi:hypothetical protein
LFEGRDGEAEDAEEFIAKLCHADRILSLSQSGGWCEKLIDQSIGLVPNFGAEGLPV